MILQSLTKDIIPFNLNRSDCLKRTSNNGQRDAFDLRLQLTTGQGLKLVMSPTSNLSKMLVEKNEAFGDHYQSTIPKE